VNAKVGIDHLCVGFENFDANDANKVRQVRAAKSIETLPILAVVSTSVIRMVIRCRFPPLTITGQEPRDSLVVTIAAGMENRYVVPS
jgi:hypothetical protein